MKKSQNALPAILFLFLGLLLFYVIMMTPDQAEDFFGNESPTTNVSQGISEEVGIISCQAWFLLQHNKTNSETGLDRNQSARLIS